MEYSEHLTEDERQTMADGSLSPERAAAAHEHLAHCGACAADVARLHALRARVTADATVGAPVDVAAADALWPAIRARIDLRKGVALGDMRASPGAAERHAVSRVRLVAGIAAAACIVAAALVGARLLTERPPGAPQLVAATNVSDSADAYQQEAQTLLDELELRRAMLRPDALTAIYHYVAVVESSIVERRAAAARDPNNAALHQLLASTYERKIEILKRIGNAG